MTSTLTSAIPVSRERREKKYETHPFHSSFRALLLYHVESRHQTDSRKESENQVRHEPHRVHVLATLLVGRQDTDTTLQVSNYEEEELRYTHEMIP